MSKQDNILQAMAALDDFTVDDLARLCDVPPTTVRTVLKRNPACVEEVGVIATDRPGGRWKRYRPRPDGLEKIEPPVTEKEGGQAPLDLIAAEEMLLSTDSIGVEQAVRSSLLRRAQRRLRHAAGDPAASTLVGQAHEQVVLGLVALVQAEGTHDVRGLRVAEAKVAKARRLLPSRVDDQILADVDRRIELSPLQVQIRVERRQPTAPSAAKEVVLAGVIGLVTKLVDSRPDIVMAQLTQRVLYEDRESGRAVVPHPVHIGPRNLQSLSADRTRTRKFSAVRVGVVPASAHVPIIVHEREPSSVGWDTHAGWLVGSEGRVSRYG